LRLAVAEKPSADCVLVASPASLKAGPALHARIRGCLLGGAVGDALGAPVEFLSLAEIRRRFGPDGIRDYAHAYGRLGAITDDTQMTLFTAEGLLRAWVRGTVKGLYHPPGVIHHAYLRWLVTQGAYPPHSGP
jgi:ADP-ribosyl-[dinitrogen reductase] hydrolase